MFFGGGNKLPSELLKKIHSEVCPEIPIESEEFTYRLIEEVSRLKQEIKERGKDQ